MQAVGGADSRRPERCVECGACRIVCPYGNIDWHYPRGGFGIVYRFG